jgi:diguanylate cyclase (GGDEF)-like protein
MVAEGQRSVAMCRHQVQFYDNDAFLLRKVCSFIVPALKGEDSAVVIATAFHLQQLRALLDAEGVDAEAVAEQLVCLDAHDTLARFMVDGLPDEQRFAAVVGGLLARLSAGGRKHVRAFGEMVAILYAKGNAAGALRLEQLWEGLFGHHAFNLLCAYPMSAFPDEGHRHAFHAICDVHSGVEPLETVENAAAKPERLHGTVARLQQAANSLERELVRRHDMEKRQAELEHLAGHDALTGLGNRRVFTDHLAQAFAGAVQTRSHLALLFVDLDGFKAVNDRFGHDTGDALLKEVAARLTQCVREGDTVCRLGGDEFTVVMEKADASQAAVLAQRIVEALGVTFMVGGQELAVRASIGISLFPDDAADVQTLVRSADRAMYRAKMPARRDLGADRRASDAAQTSPSMPDAGHDAGAAPEGIDGATLWMTVEAAATQLSLSRPHVAKLIVEKRFNNVVCRSGALPLIPSSEVSRVARELRQA